MRILIACLVTAMVCWAGAPGVAQTATTADGTTTGGPVLGPSAVYRLTSDASYTQGCWPPCLCPITGGLLTGGFRLVEIANDGTTFEYAVLGANFGVISSGIPPSSTFRGNGRYTRISGAPGRAHQMDLRLSVDGDHPRVFDSGLVNGGTNFPAIDIAVAQNGFFCYGIVLGLRAKQCRSFRDSVGR